MTDYKAIKGKTILSVASDLGNAEGEGEIWFNTATSDFKTIVSIGAWSTGGDLNTGRNALGGSGTQTAALASTGYIYPGGVTGNVEEYNGSAWSEQTNVTNDRYRLGACGTQTAGLIFGGISQLGDFFESLLKREAGIKDTSNILKGHGGILDRFDSITFAAPTTLLYINYFTNINL